jgi:cation:H+ antiporter
MVAAWFALVLAFLVLFKSASLFVDSAVEAALRLRMPKIVIGIVLVSLATTAPELTVSLMSALRGKPEMALGNAIGSVICDNGLALPLCALFSARVIPVAPAVLRSSGAFLLAIQVVLAAFVLPDFVLDRWEGAVLVLLFGLYSTLLVRQHRRQRTSDSIDLPEAEGHRHHRPAVLVGQFSLSVVGVVAASDIVVRSAGSIAVGVGIPETVVALVLVAFGTSVPEVATCIAAGRKGEGDVAVGNILGADIMCICWVAGASALANDLALTARQACFMLPSMIVAVVLMLGLLRFRYRMSRGKALLLLVAYVVFLLFLFLLFPPGADGTPPAVPSPQTTN